MFNTKMISGRPLTKGDRTHILTKIKELITSRHINVRNPNQDYRQWITLVEDRAPSLIGSADDQAFVVGVNELLDALGSSHTAFFHQTQERVRAPYSINATLRSIDTLAGKRWMFVDIIEDGPAFRAGIKPGELILTIDSESLSPPDEARFRIGCRHELQVETLAGVVRQVSIDIPNKVAKDRPLMVEPKSVSHRMLTVDVGLVKISTFPGTLGQGFARDLDGAIQELKSHGIRQVIVDLRGNLGGALGSLRLMSYLCAEKLEIGYSLTRRRLRKGYVKENLERLARVPANRTEVLTMALRFGLVHRDRSIVLVTEGLGAQPFHGRIVILVNEYTHSAAEMVASFAKENHLATLVGSTTAGEVLGGANFKLRNGYRLRIPVAGWYTWHGNCIEGIGVEPDYVIENSPQSLAAGIDTQLEKATAIVEAL